MFRRLSIASLILLPGLTGCGPPAPPPPTIVNVKLTAATDVNATAGQGAPLAIRIYQLASKTGFEGAEFFPLYKTDTVTLGADLIKKDELLLAPGTTKSLTLNPTDPVHALGIFAGYQAFQTATWRAAADIPPHETTLITVTAGPTGITLVATPGKPAGK